MSFRHYNKVGDMLCRVNNGIGNSEVGSEVGCVFGEKSRCWLALATADPYAPRRSHLPRRLPRRRLRWRSSTPCSRRPSPSEKVVVAPPHNGTPRSSFSPNLSCAHSFVDLHIQQTSYVPRRPIKDKTRACVYILRVSLTSARLRSLLEDSAMPTAP